MLHWGVIEHSRSPYSSPIVVARNKEKKRLCNDFSILNERIKMERYQLPRIQELLDVCRSKKYFAKIDFVRAFWQLKLAEEKSREATAFSCPHGHFCYPVLSFGIKTHPSIFQRCTDCVLSDHKTACNFIDYILVFEETWQAFLAALREVFWRLREWGFTLGPKKSCFGYQQVSLSGFEAGIQGLRNDPKRITAITTLPPSNTVKRCRSLLGALNFLRHFIPNLAELTRPFIDAIKEKPFRSTWQCQENFGKVKDILCKDPVLVPFDGTKRLFVCTDASTVGTAGALLQKDERGFFRVIGYTSKLLSPNEKMWFSKDIELLSVARCLDEFREFCFNHDVTVISDNIALKFFSKVKNATLRLQRLALRIEEYNIKVEFIKEKMNTLADYLSRNIANMDEKGVLRKEEEEERQEELMIRSIVSEDVNAFQDLKLRQSKDDFCRDMMAALKQDEENDFPQEEKDKLRRLSRQFEMVHGILCKKTFINNKAGTVVVLPVCLIPKVLHSYHSAVVGGGHCGKTRLAARIREKYYVQDVQRICADFVKTCKQCQKNKGTSEKKVTAMKSIEIPPGPLECLNLDTSGKYCKSITNKYYIVSLVDYFSRYIVSVPVNSIDAKSIADVIFEFICKFSCPRVIRCDQAATFSADQRTY